MANLGQRSYLGKKGPNKRKYSSKKRGKNSWNKVKRKKSIKSKSSTEQYRVIRKKVNKSSKVEKLLKRAVKSKSKWEDQKGRGN